MALFQPTFVSPDASWGIGNGTIDATEPLTVSWQVNGNSPLVAYEIFFYKNDAVSTLLHDTGMVTLSTPYYGVNAKGDNNPHYAVEFTASNLASWGITNGNEYKLIIQQWWSGSESVTQTSASAFVAKKNPTISLSSVPNPLSTREHTFTAIYSQAQGDALNWIRWQIAYADNTEEPLYDSQNIYGTAELSCYYNGFFTGSTYAIRVLIQTSSGVDADTGWVTFNVEYATNEMEGYIEVSKACNTSAVHVYWPDLFTVTGSVDGDYTLSDGELHLPEGSTATWDKKNGESFVYDPPWGVAFAGTLLAQDAILFALEQENNNTMQLRFDAASRSLILTNGNATLQTITGVNGYSHLNVVLTQSVLHVRQDYLSGGLYPASDLYPSSTLYPRADTVPTTIANEYAISYSQAGITTVQMGGVIDSEFLLISRGAISQTIIENMMSQKSYTPNTGAQNYFYASFDESLDAGSLSIGNDDVIGYAIYRIAENETVLQHIVDIGVADDGFYDYGARSQQGPYTYYVFPIGESTYVTEPIISESIDPCFWDWTLLECTQDATDESIYHVDRAFNFGKNLVSGAISNNSVPSQFETFTRYPLIQKPTQQYQSGVLTSLIGNIDYVNHNGYYDTISLRDMIWNLSRSTKPKFLKSRKGDLMMVDINDAIVMETMDETREQALTVQLPWAEVADASNVSVVSTVVV